MHMKLVTRYGLVSLCLFITCIGISACSDTQAKVSPAREAEPERATAETTAIPITPVAAADNSSAPASQPMNIEIKTDQVAKTEDDWKKELTPEQYHILREKGTERAFTGKYWDTKTAGIYKCAGCGQVLFTSKSKFDSGCGWPSFDAPLAEGTIAEDTDTSYGMIRTEVTCSRCGGHLGHVFDDGPTATGLRYCINSASIDLEEMPAPPKPGEIKPPVTTEKKSP